MRLHHRIALLVVAVGTAIGALSVGWAVDTVEEATQRELDDTTDIRSQSLTTPLTLNVLRHDAIGARETLREVVATSTDIEYAYVVDFDGRVMAHSFEGGFPRMLLELEDGSILSEPRSQSFRSEGVRLQHRSVPLLEGTRGHLALGVSGAGVEARVDALIRRAALLTIATVVVGLVLGVFGARKLTASLASLIDALDRFALSGDARRLELHGGPEERALARSFSKMVESRAEAEATVRQLNEELEQRVESRTAELRAAQRELLQKERLATLGELTATVSHEIRNPIGIVRNALFVLRRRAAADDTKTARTLDHAEEGIACCDRIIDELLDFSHPRELSTEPQPLDSWIESFLAEEPLPETIELRVTLGSGDAAVAIDSERLRRAILNLLDNARQAAEANLLEREQPLIEVITHARDEVVEIVIADSGVGFGADELERAFEPLYSTRTFGTGIGLTVVRQIVCQHGGDVTLENGERGAVATITLPRVESGDELASPPARSARPPADRPASSNSQVEKPRAAGAWRDPA